MHDNVVELFPCSSCEEIRNLDRSARSGLYVVKSSDGVTLEQASIVESAAVLLRTLSVLQINPNPSCVTALQVINHIHYRSTNHRYINPNHSTSNQILQQIQSKLYCKHCALAYFFSVIHCYVVSSNASQLSHYNRILT